LFYKITLTPGGRGGGIKEEKCEKMKLKERSRANGRFKMEENHYKKRGEE
jgi:hypothetical protein